ncbi:MAG: PorP/SprF family type IX secretion system membrane protein [Bacteroidales bacterium]|nr:PorP/SprF family type IX secretion system membrane protein [Bacteroidales bacterium]
MRKWFFILVTIMFVATEAAFAQDIHFSQFYSTPMQTSPANTGNFAGEWRAILNNKNQWNSFTNAYRTFAGSVDYSHESLFAKGDMSGLGIFLNRDVAGDGKFGTTQIMLSAAYYFPFMSEKLLVGAGFTAGYARHNIRIENLNFGSQYVTDGYDPSRESGEQWSKNAFGYFDCAVGTNAILRLNPEWSAEVGFSVAHPNMPRKTFLGSDDSRLPVKWITHATADIHVKNSLWIAPMFYTMVQQKYLEFDIGVLGRMEVNPISLQAVFFGIFARTSDAGILCAGVQYHNVRLLVNYDINLSKLTRISRGNGGIELSLVYIYSKPKPIETPYYRKCPEFM